MDKLSAKLKLGPHYAIERFGVIFLTLFSCMVILLATIVTNKIRNDHQRLSDNAIYTQSFATSKTNVSGSVVGVYTNEARTKAFLLLRFEDMSKLPLDAKDYMMFLTARTPSQNKATLTSNPKGGIYVFGSTGYMGLYFVDSNGFEPQILDVVIRSLKDLSTDEELNLSDSLGDGSFAQYDQCRIYFNPGAAGATYAEFLEQDEMTVFDIYEECVTRKNEQSIRNTLEDDLETMRSQQTLITEYTNRLESLYGMAAPVTPSQIAGDTITAKNLDGEDLTWSSELNSWVDSENLTYDEGEYYLYLNTDYVVPGGYDFVWQDGSVREGYLDALTGGTDWTTFFDQKRQEANSNAESFSTSMAWYYQNGVEFVYDASSSDDTTAAIHTEIERLTAAWSTYYETKLAYQRTHLANLLTLERNAREVERNYTTNYDDDVLALW